MKVILENVWAVLRRIFCTMAMFSTEGNVQYFGDFQSVEEVQYYGGCSVLQRMLSTIGDVQYYGQCSEL